MELEVGIWIGLHNARITSSEVFFRFVTKFKKTMKKKIENRSTPKKTTPVHTNTHKEHSNTPPGKKRKHTQLMFLTHTQ